jgi:3-mercaptopyruvate sulfurtransferase SseA
MRLYATAIATLTVLLVAGCHPEEKKDAHAAAKPVGSASVSGYQATVLEAKELKAHQDKHDIVIVDVRPPESYAREHIAGAINIPWAKLPTSHAQLPKDRFVALYCT